MVLLAFGFSVSALQMTMIEIENLRIVCSHLTLERVLIGSNLAFNSNWSRTSVGHDSPKSRGSEDWNSKTLHTRQSLSFH